MRSIDPKIISQLFTLLLILLIGGLIFLELVPYLSGILGAITIYVIFRKWMAKLVAKGWNTNLAATLIMVVSFIGILLPVGGLILMLGNKVGSAVDKSQSVVEAIKNQMFVLEKWVDYDLTSKIDPSGASSWLANNLSSFAGGTFNILVAIGIMYFLLFYMLTNRNELKSTLFEYIP